MHSSVRERNGPKSRCEHHEHHGHQETASELNGVFSFGSGNSNESQNCSRVIKHSWKSYTLGNAWCSYYGASDSSATEPSHSAGGILPPVT